MYLTFFGSHTTYDYPVASSIVQDLHKLIILNSDKHPEFLSALLNCGNKLDLSNKILVSSVSFGVVVAAVVIVSSMSFGVVFVVVFLEELL